MGRVDRSTRRQLGRYYTPAPLAAEVVRWTLGPLLGHSELNILDPACGEGVFLSDAQRFLAGRSGVHLVGVDRDASALQRAQKVLPAADLRCGDALRMDWGEERFDAVIGNPPWVSFSGRHAKELSEDDRSHYAASFESFSGWPSLHGLFLELAVRLSRGRVGLLLPAQVCDLESYAPVRTLVRRHGRVEEPCAYFGEEAFEGVSQPCCAVILDHDTNGSPGGGAPFAFSGVESTPSGHRRPPPGTFGDIGVHTGNCAGKLLRPGGAPIREGKDVQPYSLASPSKTLLADRPKLAGEYYAIRPLERYRSVPILLRQTAARPMAALHSEPTYFRNSVLACYGIPGVRDELLVAWLNSSAVARFHQASVREAGQRTFPQLKIRHLRHLPMPRFDAWSDELVETACAVARDGRLDLVVRLDRLVSESFELDEIGADADQEGGLSRQGEMGL
jgi:hypothetical protein